MPRADYGSSVTVSYIGTLEDGTVFYNSNDHGPITIALGGGEVFPALERAIVGMRAGQTRNIVLGAEEAYGPRRAENVITVERALFPADREIRVGQKLSVAFSGGASRVMAVCAVSGAHVTLDGNHPLAGHELTFALRLDLVA